MGRVPTLHRPSRDGEISIFLRSRDGIRRFFAVSNRFSPLGKGIAWRELTLEVIETPIYTPATIPAEPTQVKHDPTLRTLRMAKALP